MEYRPGRGKIAVGIYLATAVAMGLYGLLTKPNVWNRGDDAAIIIAFSIVSGLAVCAFMSAAKERRKWYAMSDAERAAEADRFRSRGGSGDGMRGHWETETRTHYGPANWLGQRKEIGETKVDRWVRDD